MSKRFFEGPILNSPYSCPTEHWELDESGQPTEKVIATRRQAKFVSPIPKPRKRSKVTQKELEFGVTAELSSNDQQYRLDQQINSVRHLVSQWRALPNPGDWKVTPITQQLLQHWRHADSLLVRPFFCQVEAVETIIWLTEVAPKIAAGKKILADLEEINLAHNPELFRICLKLATGAGKTTVMAMLIAWQTLNAAKQPGSKTFTDAFLLVAPGLTIRDRLRVLLPNDADSYYRERGIVPAGMLQEMQRAKVVITNYHAFKLRERSDVSKGTRGTLEGWRGEKLDTLETPGQMMQRVMPELMNAKQVLVLNDEAHHCYREKPKEDDEEDLKGDDRKEAEKNNEAARLWISGLEMVQKHLKGGVKVVDLSATPFFLRGSGYAEGTIFPWTVSDFSLMDAIESGIVKLPRVPVADNIPGAEMPMYRNIWEHVGKEMPKKGRGKGGNLDPEQLPTRLKTALDALYGHYEKVFRQWDDAKRPIPPCFIIVCQNTAISKLIFDYVSGYHREDEDGNTQFKPGKLELFRNFDEYGNPIARPKTLLIDSEQLESGEALDSNFRKMAVNEIERFKNELIERTGDVRAGDNISEQQLLREVMNTVGKPNTLGSSIRCVVSVSMLTEGWDANNVTHILGVRAFGTQLLCEQVIGRALRRASYQLNEEGLFDVEYADVFGVPFDFTAEPAYAPVTVPPLITSVKAVRPERDHLEIRYPRVGGYRVELPEERLEATFTPDSVLELTPALIGASSTINSGIVGESADMNLKHTEERRLSSVIFELTSRLIDTHWKDPGGEPKLHLFGQLKRIVKQWLDHYLVCAGNTYPAQLLYRELTDMACNRITAAITARFIGDSPVRAIIDPYNSSGSTAHVRFSTSRDSLWQPDSRKCHLNWIVLESDWEAELCRIVELHPRVLSYVKNYNLGFEVPYQYGSVTKNYRPDFIVHLDDGRGQSDPLQLIVEIKGFRGEDAKDKKLTMENYWIPGVNRMGTFGRWAFAELTQIYEIESGFQKKLAQEIDRMFVSALSHGKEN
ncbi:MAG: DEAD/DEAH box helicase family protein [Zavarzinella sp.]